MKINYIPARPSTIVKEVGETKLYLEIKRMEMTRTNGKKKKKERNLDTIKILLAIWCRRT